MASMSTIAVVTGANQGLGFALAEGLAQALSPEDVVYLTGRSPDRVRAAVARLARLARPRARVRDKLLDVTDGAAVSAFATPSPPATVESTSSSPTPPRA
jgi:NAD(P)-dependent dehydrogenase (short-subunit alcohol dehydrogenase family)